MTLRPPCLALLLFPAFFGQFGCATPEVWEGARRDDRTYEGIVRSVDPATGNAQLIVRYGGWAIPDAFVSLPLDSSGAPPAALTYTGKARISRQISADLSPARSLGVAQFPLTPTPAQSAANSADDVEPIFCYLAHFSIVAVALRQDGTPLPRPQSVSNDAVTFPSDCRILLLPDSIPRPIEERRASAVEATLLTPLTLAIDVALIPVGVVHQLINGR